MFNLNRTKHKAIRVKKLQFKYVLKNNRHINKNNDYRWTIYVTFKKTIFIMYPRCSVPRILFETKHHNGRI